MVRDQSMSGVFRRIAGARLVALCGAVTLGLSACGGDPLAQPLEGLNLADMAVVSRVTAELEPADAATFRTFAVTHWAASHAFCGAPLLDAQGRLPQTVGAAIALTAQREATLAAAAKAQVVDLARMSPGERRAYRLWQAQDKLGDLVDEREMFGMMASSGLSPVTPEQLAHLDSQIAAQREVIGKMRAEGSRSI